MKNNSIAQNTKKILIMKKRYLLKKFMNQNKNVKWRNKKGANYYLKCKKKGLKGIWNEMNLFNKKMKSVRIQKELKEKSYYYKRKQID